MNQENTEIVIEKAKKLMQEGSNDRENLDFEKAFTKLNLAKDLFEKEKDWYNVTECLNHLAYTHKLISQQNLIEATKLCDTAQKIATNKKTKNASILRAKISVSSAATNYEESIKTAKKLLKLYDKPANQADVLAHLADFYLRTGGKQKALITVDKALQLLEKGWKNEKDPERSIWKCKALITKSLILFNKGQLQFAKKYAEEALKLAKEHNLKSRVIQAEKVLNLL